MAATLDMLYYGETGRRRLAWVIIVPAWANWFVTLVASVLGVTGLQYSHDNSDVRPLDQVLFQYTVIYGPHPAHRY